MKNRTVIIIVLVLAILGVILIIAGYCLGADIGMISNSTEDNIGALFQWIGQLF